MVRHRAEPGAPGAHDRRLVGRQRGGARGGPLRHRHRHRTGCSIRLPASCCGVVGLKPSWGRIAGRRRLPALPHASTPSGRWRPRVAEVAAMWSVLAAAPVPAAAARRAHRRPADAAAVGRRPAAARESHGGAVRRAPRAARRTCRRGDDPRAARRHLAALLPRGRRGASGHVPVARRRVRRRTSARSSSRRRRSTRPRSRARASAVRAWRAYRPDGRPLRLAGARGRAAAGRLRRARHPHPGHGVPAPVQRPRLGGDRDRRPAVRRAARRGVLAAALAWDQLEA